MTSLLIIELVLWLIVVLLSMLSLEMALVTKVSVQLRLFSPLGDWGHYVV